MTTPSTTPAPDGAPIEAARQAIDALDDAILQLLGARAVLVAGLWQDKTAGGLPVYDASREARIYARLRERASDADLHPGRVLAIFRQIVGVDLKAG